MQIVRYLDVGASPQRDDAIDAIFHEASSVQAFEDDTARCAFRWRWLGRYLNEEPEHAFIALTDDASICGYLVGSLADPASRAEFDELMYFQNFADQTALFPAHLHINVASRWREHGIGQMLVRAFIAHAKAHRVGGVHVVTGQGMRNVHFYERLGFRERSVAPWRAGQVVLLAKLLGDVQ